MFSSSLSTYPFILKGCARALAAVTLHSGWGGNRLRSVIYHHIAEPCAFTRQIGVSTPPEVFESHVKRLSRDYDIVSLDDVLEEKLPKRPLLITFDDAYRSVLDVGAPILKTYGIQPVFFITTSPVFEGEILLENLLSYAEVEAPDAFAEILGVPPGTRTSTIVRHFLPGMSAGARVKLRDRLAVRLGSTSRELGQQMGLYLNPSDLPALDDAGFSFGSHSRTHAHMRGIRGKELETEIAEPLKQIAEATGKPVRVFSFPFGGSVQDVTPEVLETLRLHNVERWFFVGRRINYHSNRQHFFRSDMQNLDASLLTSEIESMPILGTIYARLRRRTEH